MRKITITFFLSFFIILTSFSQMFEGRDTLFGNEWIDYNLEYYKFEIGENKLFRIDYEELVSVGLIETNQSIEVKALQLHHMGEEIPIYTSTEGVFGTQDYIEFYGKKNDGFLDKYLYPNQEDHLHPKYSLFTDTSSYFLSVEPEKVHRRVQTISNELSPNNRVVDHCWQTQEEVFSQYYSNGRGFSSETSSRYVIAEGYFGEEGFAGNRGNRRISIELNTPNIKPVDEDAKVELRLFSRGSDHRYE
ncbi:MAG: hypothetical protein AAFO82_15150, partial [Bacteroidota bacterium]